MYLVWCTVCYVEAESGDSARDLKFLIVGLTDSLYATWWHVPEPGLPQKYVDRFPKKRYKGHTLAAPKLASCVESDQNMSTRMIFSSVHPGLFGCF